MCLLAIFPCYSSLHSLIEPNFAPSGPRPKQTSEEKKPLQPSLWKFTSAEGTSPATDRQGSPVAKIQTISSKRKKSKTWTCKLMQNHQNVSRLIFKTTQAIGPVVRVYSVLSTSINKNGLEATWATDAWLLKQELHKQSMVQALHQIVHRFPDPRVDVSFKAWAPGCSGIFMFFSMLTAFPKMATSQGLFVHFMGMV